MEDFEGMLPGHLSFPSSGNPFLLRFIDASSQFCSCLNLIFCVPCCSFSSFWLCCLIHFSDSSNKTVLYNIWAGSVSAHRNRFPVFIHPCKLFAFFFLLVSPLLEGLFCLLLFQRCIVVTNPHLFPTCENNKTWKPHIASVVFGRRAESLVRLVLLLQK